MLKKIIPAETLLGAYKAGLFPMADSATDEDLFWVAPPTRGILPLDQVHISRSLRKFIRKQPFEIRISTAFSSVIKSCAKLGKNRQDTWINQIIVDSYCHLHRKGHAQSVECWQDGQLVGGLYGVNIDSAFFGESMFSLTDNASKVALIALVSHLRQLGFRLLDCQFTNPHIQQFGVIEISKNAYLERLASALANKNTFKTQFEEAAMMGFLQSTIHAS